MWTLELLKVDGWMTYGWFNTREDALADGGAMIAIGAATEYRVWFDYLEKPQN